MTKAAVVFFPSPRLTVVNNTQHRTTRGTPYRHHSKHPCIRARFELVQPRDVGCVANNPQRHSERHHGGFRVPIVVLRVLALPSFYVVTPADGGVLALDDCHLTNVPVTTVRYHAINTILLYHSNANMKVRNGNMAQRPACLHCIDPRTVALGSDDDLRARRATNSTRACLN